MAGDPEQSSTQLWQVTATQEYWLFRSEHKLANISLTVQDSEFRKICNSWIYPLNMSLQM